MWRLAALSLVGVLAGPGLLLAQPAGVTDEQRSPSWEAGSGWTFALSPAGDVFSVYVADPQRPTNAIVSRFYSREGIDETRSPRAWLSAGGRFGILRMDTPGPGRRSWQVGIEAGIDAVFDAQNRSDAIGWDGNYGVTVTTASKGLWAFKVAAPPHLRRTLGTSTASGPA